MDDLEDILQGQRFEIEPVRGVVVGRYGLGIAIDHDCLDARITKCKGCVNTGVIELNSLADAVWTTAKNHHLLPVRWNNLGDLVVAAVVVGRECWELPRTGVNRLEYRPNALCIAPCSDLLLADTSELGQLAVAETVLLGLP